MNIFGISFLNQKEGALLRKQWDQLPPMSSFLVQQEANWDCSRIIEELTKQIQSQWNTISFPKDPCILAFFVDLQQNINPNIFSQIEEAIRKPWVIGCVVQESFQFGYVGNLALQTPLDEQRERTIHLIESNKNVTYVARRVLLVAGAALLTATSEMCWKVVVTFLDGVARGQKNGLPQGPIGFLCYAEYDQLNHQRMLKRQEELKTILGNGDSQAFEELLTKKGKNLRQAGEAAFPICSNLQPLHPEINLKVKKYPFSKSKKKIDAAQKNSQEALKDTAQFLIMEMKSFFQQEIANAGHFLEGAMDQAGLGYQLRKDEQEMSCLLSSSAIQRYNDVPALDSQGWAEEIQTYLLDVRRYAIDRQIAEYYSAMKEAALEMIRDKKYDDMIHGAEAELDEVLAKLECIVGPGTFCEKYTNTNVNLPVTTFAPNIANISEKRYILCRGDLVNQAKVGIQGGNAEFIVLPPNPADSNPLRAVQAVFLNGQDSQQLVRALL